MSKGSKTYRFSGADGNVSRSVTLRSPYATNQRIQQLEARDGFDHICVSGRWISLSPAARVVAAIQKDTSR
jgi:hypothetical protein